MPFGYHSLFKNEKQSHLFGMYIRINRNDQNLSLIQLSEIVGITPSYLSAIEKGKKTPSDLVMLSLCDGLDISFDLKKTDEEIVETIKLFFRNCLEKNNKFEIDNLYTKIVSQANYESFNFPYVLLIKAIYKTVILHTECDENEINLMLELSEFMDNSYKIAVLDLFSLNKKLIPSSLELEHFYQMHENFIQVNKNSNGSIGQLPLAVYSIHACIFYLNMNNQVKTLQYCKIANFIFQATLCIHGLFSINAIMSNVYAQMNQFSIAISIQKELLTVIDDSLKKGECLENIGKLLFQNGDYCKAIDYFRRSIIENKNVCQSRYYLLYILLSTNEKQNKTQLLDDISEYEDMLRFYYAVSCNDSSVFDLFNQLSDSIKDSTLKKLYFHFIYEYAKKINSAENTIYYADKYITILTSVSQNTTIKLIEELMKVT